MAQRNFKNLARRTQSDKLLTNKACNIAKNSKYGRYQGGLASMVYKFFDKKNPQVVVLIMKLNKMRNFLKNITNQLLKNSKKEKFILHLNTIFGELIQQICS